MGHNKKSTIFGDEIWDNNRYLNCDHPLDHWKSMPEFLSLPEDCFHTVKIIFEDPDDVKEFYQTIGYIGNESTKKIWFPKQKRIDNTYTRYVSDRLENHQPKYPIFIPSKGRYEIRLTSNSLIDMGIKHYIIVEEHEYEMYKKNVDSDWVTLLVLPKKYFDEYDTCDDLGSSKSKGPGAARNFAWDHSIRLGYKRHWVMDDNIDKFYRMNKNKRVPVADGAIIRAMEDHADMYRNVYMSGPNYKYFAVPSERLTPFTLNTRIYSCNLILNDIPFRWRGRYNEDTDLSLRILKSGNITIQYYAFLANKIVTQKLSGGNTDEFYIKEGTLPKSKMLEELHSDVAKVKWRFNRWHHYVDYNPFKSNRLIPDDNYDTISSEMYNYGMIYTESFNQ